MSEYKWKISLQKAGKAMLFFGVTLAGGFVFGLDPSMTATLSIIIGGFITGFLNWFKNRKI